MEELAIFGIAWFSFWVAIPSGLAMGVHPVSVALITIVSYISGVVICVLPAHAVRQWVMRRFAKQVAESNQEDQLVIRLWQKYGVIGFGLVAPMTIGAQIGALLGITLNIERKRLVVWMTIGAIVWAIGLTLSAVAGLNLVVS